MHPCMSPEWISVGETPALLGKGVTVEGVSFVTVYTMVLAKLIFVISGEL